MIVGDIICKTGVMNYRYTVNAFDTSEVFSMYITAGFYDAIQYMASSDITKDDPDLLWERAVEVKLSKVVVQTAVNVGANGRSVKSPVNADFFCRLAALIRYAKANCTTQNEEGYTGLRLASGEFEAKSSKKYIVPFPADKNKVFAEVVLEYGNIVSLKAETKDFTINLYTSDDQEDRVFYKPKGSSWTSGFRLNTEYLGFEVPEVRQDIVNSDGMYHNIEEIVKAHPDKEFSWLLDRDYHIVTDETLEEVCNYLYNHDGYVFFDTETTGLNINFLSRVGQADQCVGIILSVKEGESFFFPLQMKAIKNLCGGDHWYVVEHYLKPILEDKELVAHNMSFDWKVGYIYEVNCNIVHDTMAILELTLAEEIKDYKVGLKENTKVLLGRDALELSDLVVSNEWGENDIAFWDLPEELVKLYACADTDDTQGLFNYCMSNDLLGKYGASKVYEIEIAFSYAVAYQEFYGHHIDITNLDKLRIELGEEQKEYMAKMVEIVGHEFNPNSPQQLQQVMYKELGIPEQISRKTGRVTTDKETLSKLAEITDAEDNVKYPFCKLLKEYREYEGVRKIVDKFPEHMTDDGYIFSDVMQYGTTTGRVSIHNPNYQSYNNPIKKNVIPRPGFYMTDTDYSSIEYRVLANMVGNKRIMESFEDPDFDYHTYQAAHMYNVPYSAVTKTLRKAAKGINFGLPYGMGDESLGVRVFGEESEENTRKAASLRAAYFKGQEDIRDWFETNRDKGVNLGYTETFFGRRRYYRRSDFSIGAIRRQAGNQIIQGCINYETTLITKEYGVVRIGDIVNEHVTLWDGEQWTDGTVVYSGKKRLCKVHFKGGQVFECSPTHKFCVVSYRGNTRWVDCSDLVGVKDVKNRQGYHVMINHDDFDCSGLQYSSEEFYKYRGTAHNSKDYFLDMIKDPYKLGIALGRLASDGNYSAKSGDIVWIVAEHEIGILDELLDCLSVFDVHIRRIALDNRNEELFNLCVYSKSLACELDALDVRHTIPRFVFMNMQTLRGYLRGFIDGDGGVSGRAIAVTWGTQYDFEPMVLDMQKALLCFGIRSRYRKYEDDRYVLQIKTNDNDLFLERIGFMSSAKSDKAVKLCTVEDEHVFGRCLMVDYVEFTDEYVDMYDVCDTDRGQYIADGLVVHNSAADIYKIAAGRVFKRICREGWLGKVLMVGFIHDELLAEVSNEINPGIWLKALREEFEVKVTNDDGSPWCPLYMGFGFGMSWYEAKSVEIPIKLQWELVEKYGDSGFPNWDGDGRKFCDGIPDLLRDFEVRDIRTQITDPEAQGKEIKPALNSQVLDCVKTDSSEYKKYISEYLDSSDCGDSWQTYLVNNEMDACKYLDSKCHIQRLYKVNNVPLKEFVAEKSTQGALDQYCMLHGVDRNTVNILDIEEYSGTGATAVDDEEYVSEEDSSAERLQHLRDVRIDTLGMYVDTDEMRVTLLMLPAPWMQGIQRMCNKNGKGYRVLIKDSYGLTRGGAAGQMYITNSYISSVDLNLIQQLYLQYFKKKNAGDRR